ncbi:MAG: alpha-ketoglutarate-dependent dioxygenase AlkB [Actinomycetota bacterium]
MSPLQGSLFGSGEPALDALSPQRVDLDERSWIDHQPGWVRGADTLFDQLLADNEWRQRTQIPMYDRLVDEPRLVAGGEIDAAITPVVLADAAHRLGAYYDVDFDSLSFNLYRTGADSVAWHGDRHRHTVRNPLVAIVSLGEPRPFGIRRRGGGAGRRWLAGGGDLLVMGGACQHEWEHAVPKVAHAGPRISVMWRHGVP